MNPNVLYLPFSIMIVAIALIVIVVKMSNKNANPKFEIEKHSEAIKPDNTNISEASIESKKTEQPKKENVAIYKQSKSDELAMFKNVYFESHKEEKIHFIKFTDKIDNEIIKLLNNPSKEIIKSEIKQLEEIIDRVSRDNEKLAEKAIEKYPEFIEDIINAHLNNRVFVYFCDNKIFGNMYDKIERVYSPNSISKYKEKLEKLQAKLLT